MPSPEHTVDFLAGKEFQLIVHKSKSRHHLRVAVKVRIYTLGRGLGRVPPGMAGGTCRLLPAHSRGSMAAAPLRSWV